MTIQSQKAIWFTYNSKRIEKGIDLRNGKSNPYGWSTYEVWRILGTDYPGVENEFKIGDLYCGEPMNLSPGYSYEFEELV